MVIGEGPYKRGTTGLGYNYHCYMELHKEAVIIFHHRWHHFQIDLSLRNVVVAEPPPNYSCTTRLYDFTNLCDNPLGRSIVQFLSFIVNKECLLLLLLLLELRPILPAVTPLALLALWLAFSAVTPHIIMMPLRRMARLRVCRSLTRIVSRSSSSNLARKV